MGTEQPPITTLIKQRLLKLFVHVARAGQAEDHNPALRASLNPPSNWRRPRRRPRQTWLQTVSDDLNLGLHSAYRQVLTSSFVAEDCGNSYDHTVGMPDDKYYYTDCCIYAERNGVSFIETSALDSTNVETAFTSLLTGQLHMLYLC